MSSANDDTLLEDGDEEEEYDLKYEDEEALLAEIDELDDNKPQEIVGYSKKSSGRKNHYTSESNIYRDTDDAAGDDVLELYEEELDNILSTDYAEEEDYSENKDHLGGGEQQNAVVYRGHSVHKSTIKIEVGDHHEVDASEVGNEEDIVKDELMEINEEEAVRGQKDSEDEEEEEKDEGRGRFKSERTTVISLKGSKTYGNIPDTLDSVITGEEKVETGAGRWKRGGGGGRGGAGFQRGGFRGNQRGAGINFGARRKQMGRQEAMALQIR
ncbi:uncharacterized protein LOC124163792 [Ischnura elegans]|uniref:uncharacterized protein LOC124163792 n=1 Tax=Ischnura elegans TaxID=197161 RepID=UPI001ED8AE6D|nr:uncharacterized protein LOC124163792 [Ischnura elegans]